MINRIIRKGVLASGLLVSTLFANNSFGSEASHFVGHFALAGIGTELVEHYFPEYRQERAWIGFWTSAAVGGILTGIDLARDHDDVSGELSDFGVSLLGGATGAYVTDRWILSPLVHEAPDGSKTFGVQAQHSF